MPILVKTMWTIILDTISRFFICFCSLLLTFCSLHTDNQKNRLNMLDNSEQKAKINPKYNLFMQKLFFKTPNDILSKHRKSVEYKKKEGDIIYKDYLCLMEVQNPLFIQLFEKLE